MRRAKAVIVASYNEGFGRMTAEAAFNGTLVIGRNTAGTKEILDVVGGFPFDGDYIVIAEQMNAVHNLSKEEYNRLAQKAQELAVQQYSTEKNIEKITKLYYKILS